MTNPDSAIPLTQAISAVRATLFDLRNDPKAAKMLATETDIRQAMPQNKRPVPSPIDFDIAIEHLKETGQIGAVVSPDGTEYTLTPKGYNEEEESRVPWWRRGDALDGLGKGLALVALLLPVSGAVLRGFAFFFGPHLTVSATQLAWSASPAQLIATGFLGLFGLTLVAVVTGILFILSQVRIGDRGRKAFAQFRQSVFNRHIPRPMRRILFVVVLLAGGAAFLDSANGPTTLVALVAGFITGTVGSSIAERPGPLRLGHFWPLIVTGLLASAFITGLSGNLSGVQGAEYKFAPSSSPALPDGRYVALGNFDNLAYLYDCRHPGVVEAVPENSIALVKPVDTAMPVTASLLDVFLRHKSFAIGFRPPC